MKNMKLNLNPEEYLRAVENQAKPLIIPLSTEMEIPKISPMDVYLGLQNGHGFLLESMEGSEKIARYSFIGIDPQLLVSIDDTIKLEGDKKLISIAEAPEGKTVVDKIKSIMHRFSFINVKAPRFFGGMVGYFSYDLIYSLSDKIQKDTIRDVETPIAQFMLTKDCIVFDHVNRKLYIFNSPLLTYDSDPEEEYEKSEQKILEMKEKIEDLGEKKVKGLSHKARSLPDYSTNISKDEFEHAVEKAREYIYAGDILQAVISKRIECDLSVDPFSVYRALREINPSPYLYFLDFGGLKVIGSSPEMLVRVENGRVMTVPIAGTRPRGADKKKDDQLAKDLLRDEKERAEHVMLVDLARNDIGRVCKYGSVHVDDFMSIEKFSHVQHIVSTVSGVLRDNLDCYDVLKSCFPAGTVSGAPKIRAMQIIEELEKSRRGIYAGAIGYIGFNKNMDFAITIRTLIAKGDKIYVQVGAGIVADSNPESEWYETENKGKGMLKAIEKAGEIG